MCLPIQAVVSDGKGIPLHLEKLNFVQLKQINWQYFIMFAVSPHLEKKIL